MNESDDLIFRLRDFASRSENDPEQFNSFLVDHIYPLFISLHSSGAFSDQEEQEIKYMETLQALRTLYIIFDQNEVQI